LLRRPDLGSNGRVARDPGRRVEQFPGSVAGGRRGVIGRFPIAVAAVFFAVVISSIPSSRREFFFSNSRRHGFPFAFSGDI
jgi:hypothetical protein